MFDGDTAPQHRLELGDQGEEVGARPEGQVHRRRRRHVPGDGVGDHLRHGVDEREVAALLAVAVHRQRPAVEGRRHERGHDRGVRVAGPLQPAGHAYAAVVPAFVSAALDGRALTVHGDGKQSRDFTFVDTVTEVIADAIARHVTSATPVNLAFGTRTDLLTLIAELEAVLGSSVAVEHVDTRAGDVRHSQADSTRLQELFPDVVPTALPDALRSTVDW